MEVIAPWTSVFFYDHFKKSGKKAYIKYRYQEARRNGGRKKEKNIYIYI